MVRGKEENQQIVHCGIVTKTSRNGEQITVSNNDGLVLSDAFALNVTLVKARLQY